MNDLFQNLKKWTQARVGLDMSGHSLSTEQVLQFKMAHAKARDAVLTPWNHAGLKTRLEALGFPSVTVATAVESRHQYLQRPDLGRRLSPQSASQLSSMASSDLVVIISDGLSSTSVETHLIPFWLELSQTLQPFSLRMAPLVLAPFSRVAASDEIGHLLGAHLAIILIGERPGLSSTDSLGAYLTYDPHPGKADSDRNCISNIRPPFGLSYRDATEKLTYLVRESLSRKISGVSLKENSLPREIEVSS